MADEEKSRFINMKNGFYSSRNQTVNSYSLRSASKNNASKKQGVYSKFLNRTNVSKNINMQQTSMCAPRNETFHDAGFQYIGARRYDPSNSRIDQTQNLNSRKSLFRGNESFKPKPGTSQNMPLRAQNGMPLQNGASTSKNNESRLRQVSPPLRSPIPIRNGHMDMSSRDAASSSMRYSRMSPEKLSIRGTSATSMRYIRSPERDVLNSSARIGLDLSPKVMLKRFDPLMETYGRPVGLKRDQDGFVVPCPPNSKRRCEEEKRATKKLISELTDIMYSAEAFYFLKRCEEVIDSCSKKIVSELNGCDSHLDSERKRQVANWLQSTTNSEVPLPIPASVISAIPREVLQDYAASVISSNQGPQPAPAQQWGKEPKSVYSLRDWTLVKGRAPLEVMVSGDLRDITNYSLIEESHISSKVLGADSVVIQTSCCIYHLNGEFQDPSNSIPNSVKKYFQEGKFPKEWIEVIRMWSILRDKENVLYTSDRNNRTAYDDLVPEKDDGRGIRQREIEKKYVRDDGRFQERIPERDVPEISVRGRLKEGQTIQTQEHLRNRGKEELVMRERQGDRIRSHADERIRERDERIHEREGDRIILREDERIRERENGRIREREDERIRDMEDERIRREDERVRKREVDRIRERENERMRERDDERIRNREDERIRSRERELRGPDRRETACDEDDEIIHEIPERDYQPRARERGFERDENGANERVWFRGDEIIRRRDERHQEVVTVAEVHSSRVNKKRKSDTLEDSQDMQRVKRSQLENTIKRRILDNTASKRNTTILTRSAKRLKDSLYCTPKSSKRNTLKLRRKTPMPPRRGRRIDCESFVSESFDNSDLM